VARIVTVQVRADLAARFGLSVLPPVVEPATGDVERRAVRIDIEDDEDRLRQDEPGDRRVVAVAVHQPAHDRQRHFE